MKLLITGRPMEYGIIFSTCRFFLSSFFPRLISAVADFSANFYCAQTAGCITMPLGMEVSLSLGDFVFDGEPALPPQKGAEPPPQFLAHVYCGQTAG